jgi:site-specific recombinase XerD
LRHDEFLEGLVARLWAKDLPGKKHAEGYLRHQHRRNFRRSSIRHSEQSIELFLSYLKGAGKAEIEQMNWRDVEGFIEHEQDRGLKLSTVRTRLGILKAFLRFLIDHGVVDEDVLPWKLRIKVPEALPRAMDPDDVERLLGVVDQPRDRAMVLVLLRTGMRIGELLNTLLVDVDMREKKILIFESEKNRFGRVVYFSDDARAALEVWLKHRDQGKERLFYARARQTMSYVAARMMFVKYLRRAGLCEKGYTLHCLRHTFATELLNAGMRLECLEKLLGHTSLEVTRRYARLTDRTREEEYFRAMAVIERGEGDVHYGCDRELQEVLETTQLLPPYGEELPQPA